MPRNNGAERKQQRREVAQANAEKPQVDCADCGNRHREGRHKD